MIGIFARLFARAEPALSEANPRDASAIAALHARSFRHGWSDGEFERMLGERNIVAHRATTGRSLHGFILSRLAAGEAEILSVSDHLGTGIAHALSTRTAPAARVMDPRAVELYLRARRNARVLG